ncbi:DUF87 domain-containing protein [Candidatus Dojkabacteria bacterium]|jgi:type IV secretory pathway VirB4 component|nr:DUF87 domain-containing protein [Candidatus Dojkabacteria bacterium]
MANEILKNKTYESQTQQLLKEKEEKLTGGTEKLRLIQEEINKPAGQKFVDKERFEPTEIKKKNPLQFLFNMFSIYKKKDEKASEKITPPKSAEGLTIQDIIAPRDIEIDFTDVLIGEMFYRTFFLSGYPRFVGPNWLSPIINFEYSLRISSFYYPVDSKVVLEKLKRKIGEMEATIYTQMEGRKAVDPSLKIALQDAQQLQDSIAEGTEKYFHFGMYITISASTKDELEKISKNVVNTLAAINVIAKPAMLQQEQGIISTQPLGLDQLYITRNMDTSSIAYTFPFVTSELTMDHGVMYGINQHNKSLVVFDRFSLENANTVVFAKAGAGKSYFVKLEAVRSLMLGTEIIIIDPEREYKDLCDAVGGIYISFSQDKGDKMNPFELSGLGDADDDELRMKLLSLQGFFKILFGDITSIQVSILDRALLLTYREKGITLDPTTQRNANYPLLEDLYKVLKGMAETEAHDLAQRLERYILGSGAGIFNEKSTVELKNPFTVFSVRDLQEELRPLAMYLMLDYIWTRIRKDKKRRIMIVDEAWYMMQYPESAKFMYSIAKRARKYYLGLTTITQDVDDFIKEDMGKAIISNSAIQMLMKQSPSSIDRLQKVFNLSEGEKNYLLSCDQGQGLFFAGPNHVAIQVVASKAENYLITTNPVELEKRAKDGIPQDMSKEDLSSIFEPPAVQRPIKDGVDTNQRDIIQKAISQRKEDIKEIVKDKIEYQTYLEQKEREEKYGINASPLLQTATPNLTDQIVAQREQLQKDKFHLTPQGEIGLENSTNDQQSTGITK